MAAALEASPDTDLVLLDLTMPGMRGFSGLLFLRAERPRPARDRRLRQRRPRGDSPLSRIRRRGLSSRSRIRVDIDARRPFARCSTAADGLRQTSTSSPVEPRVERAGPPALLAHAAADSGLDDAVAGPAQQADRLRAQRLRGDRQGACLRDPAKARRRKPDPGGHPRRPRSSGAGARSSRCRSGAPRLRLREAAIISWRDSAGCR